MELPTALRQAVDSALANQPIERLTQASERLSNRYRKEVRDGAFHIDDDLAAKAYLATRLPATFAAVRAALGMVEDLAPGFSPASLIDVGAGPGTALWAAADCWPSLAKATMLEASPAIRSVGEALSRPLGFPCDWRAADLLKPFPTLQPAELVTLAYVLDEIEGTAIVDVTRRLWALTSSMIVIIEPGTPAGWRRILAVRQALMDQGAHLVAPCPHAAPCPIVSPDWCHFSRRVARSRTHRLAKQGEVPWEDEKYIFIAASRDKIEPPAARVLAPPRLASGVARLKLCRSDGSAAEVTVSRRHGDAFREARRLDWGDITSIMGTDSDEKEKG
ncbi:small ribosomal subunit Rsm22 family protein [Rhizobium sp. RU36D]|uniref:small ribosomal subunit Rsm22 family protein n=1 Tax=Rhizobium sp. RU36D TaxID=1907415 RepID=UPI0009D8AAAB|nr:small ribosomal subunit Rsm22 family protein [Rhizobium sp. RU36D]SMD09212.1 Ribosomal protein RSM22 (predicted rRNA methylase) [Rhizobium sp. RU36D]